MNKTLEKLGAAAKKRLQNKKPRSIGSEKIEQLMQEAFMRGRRKEEDEAKKFGKGEGIVEVLSDP